MFEKIGAAAPQTTVTPDCLDVSGSVSSAGVLFTVDMLNYQSITINLYSAGSGCTIVWETSSDNSSWLPTMGTSITASSFGTSLSAAGVVSIPKRLRWFRARVSVYGSGTVSASANLLSQHSANSLVVSAGCYGISSEGVGVSGAPVMVAVEGRSSSKTPVSNGQVVRPIATLDGRLVMRPHSIPENEWAYAPPSGGLVNSSSPVVFKAAAGGTLRNYLTSIQVMAEALTNATELTIENGDGTVLWRTKIPTTGLSTAPIRFDDPIKSTANASLQIRTVTASGAGAVYFNAQGYIAL